MVQIVAALVAVRAVLHEVPPRTHCSNGPYIWDLSNHTEGIGSTLQHRKQSLILSNTLGAPWIGTLENEHDAIPRPNNQRWLGLGDTDCTSTMLGE